MIEKEIRDYINNYISHILDMVEYGNSFYIDINKIIEKTRKDIDDVLQRCNRCSTKKTSQVIKNKIETFLIACEEEISAYVTTALEDITQIEDEWLEQNVEKPLNITLTKTDTAKKKLLLIPIATAGVVGILGKTIKKRLEDIYHSIITTSYISGATFGDLEDDFASRFNSFNNGLRADIESVGSTISNQYDRIVYTRNDNKIQKYMWLSILDSRTCLVCSELDHTIYNNIQDVPIYPKHDRCRCQVIPFTDEMLDFIPESYEEWFEKQSSAEKKHILGKTRFQLYEQGMKIKQFVNNGRITPLSDLKTKK